MGKRKQLSKRQLAVIDDLFGDQLDEQAVLDKHKLSRNVYNKWLADELFVQQFNQRVASAHRQSELIIARYAPLAAAKLVQLTGSEKEETARKACLDIISLPELAADNSTKQSNSQQAAEPQIQPLSDQTASKLLAALAAEKEKTVK